MPQTRQDSNSVGLRFAEEASPKTLGGSPVWYPLEPNSFGDFGGEPKQVARAPISAGRQRKRSVTVGMSAGASFNQDLTQNNLTRLLQGFFFADVREKPTTAPMNGTQAALTTVSGGNTYTGPGTTFSSFAVGALVLASGYSDVANNGLAHVSSKTATTLVVSKALTNNATNAPAAARIDTVGHRASSGTLAISRIGNLVRLVSTTGPDFVALGLIPGEWIYLGDDTASNRFVNNVGFARISTVTTGYLEFDKVTWTAQTEDGTGKTISIYFGNVLRNESTPNLIKKRTYQLERTLGNDDDGTQSQYVAGAYCNELTLNLPNEDKVTVDLGFVALDDELRTGVDGLKGGGRPNLSAENAFNTAQDFYRTRLAAVTAADAAPAPLNAYFTELSLSIKNNISPDKAVGVMGGFGATAGSFDIDGSATAYFCDMAAVKAVRNNTDTTLDFCITRDNAGQLWDIPLMGLGGGKVQVEANRPITLPLTMGAGESKFGNTLTFISFPYLPTLAM